MPYAFLEVVPEVRNGLCTGSKVSEARKHTVREGMKWKLVRKKYHGNRIVWEGNLMVKRWVSFLTLMISNFIQFTLNTELWTRTWILEALELKGSL